MAFNLNKNDGADSAPSTTNKTASKFDLSKKEAVEPVITEPASQSKTWIIGLVGILIIGGGLWYFTSRPESSGSTVAASTETATKDTSSKVATAPPAEVQPAGSTDTTIAASTKNTTTTTPVSEASAADPVNTKTYPSGAGVAKLNNTAPASFGEGSAKFKRMDKSLVRRIISYLTKNPEASIYVNGYASSDGPLAINQTVSQARADAFKTYLVSKNIAENRVVAAGKGIENPIASNDTDAGRKKNRRVEVTFQ